MRHIMDQPRRGKECPHCFQNIPVKATVCNFCGREAEDGEIRVSPLRDSNTGHIRHAPTLSQLDHDPSGF